MKTFKEYFKEESEQLDELSKSTLQSYVQKVSTDAMKNNMDPTKRSPEKRSKAVSGFAKAVNKLTKESEEQLEEE